MDEMVTGLVEFAPIWLRVSFVQGMPFTGSPYQLGLSSLCPLILLVYPLVHLVFALFNDLRVDALPELREDLPRRCQHMS